MDIPRWELLGQTWLGWVNILFFQWFFVRLTIEIFDYRVYKIGLTLFPLPLTGWRSDYINLFGGPTITLWFLVQR
jgi:hypothetical protein